jgi:hypothetical protein
MLWLLCPLIIIASLIPFHVIHRSSENYRHHSPDYMLDKEEIEMRRLWHAGQLVEPRVKLIKLQAAQEHPKMSINSGCYHQSQENPLLQFEELQQAVLPLTRKKESPRTRCETQAAFTLPLRTLLGSRQSSACFNQPSFFVQ